MPIGVVVAGNLMGWSVLLALGAAVIRHGFRKVYESDAQTLATPMGTPMPIRCVAPVTDDYSGSVAQTVARHTGRFRRTPVYRGVAKVVRRAKHATDNAVHLIRRHGRRTLGQVWDVDMSAAFSWFSELRNATEYQPKHGA